MTSTGYECLAVAPPGLETCVEAELKDLGYSDSVGPAVAGGVPFRTDLAGVHRANLRLRVASRVLVRLGRFTVRGFAELERKAAGLPWTDYLTPDTGSVRFDVTCRKSKLHHSGAVAERLERVASIAARVGSEARDADPEQRFVVRIVRDRCTVSVDASGEHLHRRGYREESTAAPLRETLAAALLSESGWDPDTPLVDPFCGSGTIPIEAARWARKLPPGGDRHFSARLWPVSDGSAWEAELDKARQRARSTAPSPVWGFDRNHGAVSAAAANAQRAGVAADVEFARQTISELSPVDGPPGAVVTNPPYGRRLSRGTDLRALYARFGSVLRDRFPGWRVAFLTSDPALAGQTGLELSRTLRFKNGGIPVDAWVGRI